MSNVEGLVSLGVFDVSGMTPETIGRLEKNTRVLTRTSEAPNIFNQAQLYRHIVTSGEYVGKQHVSDSAYPYRVVRENGAYMQIAKIVYDAITLPEVQ